jgi:hypothetical protein
VNFRAGWKRIAIPVIVVAVFGAGLAVGIIATNLSNGKSTSARAVALVTIPDLKGDPVLTASQKLEALGLRVSIGTATAPSAGYAIVSKESPSAGSQVAKGTEVTLTVDFV